MFYPLRFGVASLIVATSLASPYQDTTPSGCEPTELAAAVARVHASRAALRRLTSPEDDMGALAPEAEQAIGRTKAGLGDLVNAYMRCAGPDIEATQIKAELSRLAKAFQFQDITKLLTDEELESFRELRSEADASVLSDLESHPYGFELYFHVKKAEHQPLLSITATFGIECGSDSVLFVFNREGGAWREVIRWQGEPRGDIKDAFWEFDHAVSPPDESGSWYVLTKHISPWCTSNWRVVRYSILRTGADAQKPSVIFSAADPIFISDHMGTLTANASDFLVRFHSSSLDAGLHNRVWVRHFAVERDNVTRLPPVADSPLDFVDEWLRSDWKDASAWTSGEVVGALGEQHAHLSSTAEKGRVHYESVRRCPNVTGVHQVEVVMDWHDDSSKCYFRVEANAGRFVMVGISITGDPGCQGPNLLSR